MSAMDRLDGTTVAGLLYRRDVAMARHRAALSRRLGLSDIEVVAVLHLAHRTELTTARLGALLDLSSGGATALVQRLERLGVTTRRPHPEDRRSSLIRLAPRVADELARASAPLDAGTAEAMAALDPDEAGAVAGFLERLAELSEELTAAGEDEDAPERATLARPVPSLWG